MLQSKHIEYKKTDGIKLTLTPSVKTFISVPVKTIFF